MSGIFFLQCKHKQHFWLPVWDFEWLTSGVPADRRAVRGEPYIFRNWEFRHVLWEPNVKPGISFFMVILASGKVRRHWCCHGNFILTDAFSKFVSCGFLLIKIYFNAVFSPFRSSLIILIVFQYCLVILHHDVMFTWYDGLRPRDVDLKIDFSTHHTLSEFHCQCLKYSRGYGGIRPFPRSEKIQKFPVESTFPLVYRLFVKLIINFEGSVITRKKKILNLGLAVSHGPYRKVLS